MKNKLKTLIFIDWFYPAHKAGGPIRSVYNIVQALAKDMDTYIVTSAYDIGDVSPLSNIVIDEWIKKEAYSILYLARHSQNRRKYKSILNTINPDVVYLNSLFSLGFTIKPLLSIHKNSQIKIVLAPRGMLKPDALAIKSLKKQIFLLALKTSKYLKNIIWHASSEVEKQEVCQYFGKSANVMVAQNISTVIPLRPINTIKKESGSLKLIFFSRINPIKNLDFLLNVLAQLKNPNVNLDIYGPIEDVSYWRACIQFIKHNLLNVNYKGVLNQGEKEKILWQYDFLILPTKGENFGHVIAESLSASLPVIISQNTPWRSLHLYNSGYDLPLKIDEFVKTLRQLVLLDHNAYLAYSEGAKAYSEKFILNKNIIKDNKKLFIND